MNSGEKIIPRPESPSADAIDALALAQLIARVEAATGADRELDEDILEATNPHKSGPYAHHRAAAVAFGWNTRLTSSLDAALALVERVLPGWEFSLEVEHRGDGDGSVWRCAMGDPCYFHPAEAPTPALALILALLKALAALAETPG